MGHVNKHLKGEQSGLAVLSEKNCRVQLPRKEERVEKEEDSGKKG